MGARHYGPAHGSFLQEHTYGGALNDLGLSMDPINNNRYSLAAGNPISYIETDGHKAIGNANQSDSQTDFAGNTDGSDEAGAAQQAESAAG